ncbi:MAG: HaeII family restriction endonuclease, partial [Halothece sp. Uz-M2-17]|nr:HaeII family restriction endonuclease [Halothece sp. Uz-M2-17]
MKPIFTISLKICNPDQAVVKAFQDFLETVVGIDNSEEISIPAKLYRVGVTNAADRGLDMWCNFGPAVQVKHLTLTEELAGDVASTVSSDRIVIVCKD